MEAGVLGTALLVGFLFGLRHATDADHVAAVSTIVGEERNPWRGVWVGASWGLGHSVPLLLVGVVILALGVAFPEPYSMALEFGVGVMLVLLGAQVFWNLRRRRVHFHSHDHRGEVHRHLHAHEPGLAPNDHHGLFRLGKPVFRPKSFAVGVVHGLAGSAAVMLLVLTTVPSFWAGIGYIVLFGVGSVVSMALLTLAMGVPFALAAGRGPMRWMVSSVAGLVSIVLGALLMYQIGVHEGLLV